MVATGSLASGRYSKPGILAVELLIFTSEYKRGGGTDRLASILLQVRRPIMAVRGAGTVIDYE
jgi:hypothetical protein